MLSIYFSFLQLIIADVGKLSSSFAGFVSQTKLYKTRVMHLLTQKVQWLLTTQGTLLYSSKIVLRVQLDRLYLLLTLQWPSQHWNYNWNTWAPARSSNFQLVLFRALKLCGSGGPPHVKLIIEWEHRIKDWSALFSSSILCLQFFFFLRETDLCNGLPWGLLFFFLSVCLVTFRRRWWRMQRMWGTGSSTSISTAAPWMSVSIFTPKRSR